MNRDIEIKELNEEFIEDIPGGGELIETEEETLDDLIPKMNVALPVPAEEAPKPDNLIADEAILGIYSEMLDIIREDRKQVSDYVDNFADMVMNEGDSTTSSKEALVNLVKLKTDMVDKMHKVADLMTRLKMKDKNTFAYSGAHFNAMQNNTINIGDGAATSKRALLDAIKKEKNDKKRGKSND